MYFRRARAAVVRQAEASSLSRGRFGDRPTSEQNQSDERRIRKRYEAREKRRLDAEIFESAHGQQKGKRSERIKQSGFSVRVCKRLAEGGE